MPKVRSPDTSPLWCQKPGHLAARLGCAETKVATWDDLAFKLIGFKVERKQWYGYCKNLKKTVKTGQTRTLGRKEHTKSRENAIKSQQCSKSLSSCKSATVMFLWEDAVATACYTQNRSPIHTRHNKTPYELVHDKKPDLTFLRVFGALCYPTNDSEDLGKLQPTADIGIFVGYAPSRKGYRIYNKKTRRIMETIHVQIDELSEPMAPVQLSTGPAHLTHGQIKPPRVERPVSPAPAVPVPNPFAPAVNDPFVNVFALEPSSKASSFGDVSFTESTHVTQPHYHLGKWSKDHPLDNVIGNPSRPVSTRKQLATDALWCLYNSVLSKVEPKNFKSTVTEDCWFQAMQDEIHKFDLLQVWKLVPRPDCVMIIALKWIYKVKLDEYGDHLKKQG
ncbi:putative ribonuclease H-like domain-containing protein [Tanacetum coccineum]